MKLLTNCLICGSNVSNLVQLNVGHDQYLRLLGIDSLTQIRSWIKCLNCGLMRQSNILDESETNLLYQLFRSESIRQETPDSYFDRITKMPVEMSENNKRCAWMNGSIPKSGSILDIGCGGGVFLNEFKRFFGLGWDIAGIEPTPEYASLASRRLGVNIETGMFNERSFSGQLFDLITINHVLEHISNPLEFLKNAFALLKPDGAIYLKTPDQSDFGFLPTNHDRFSLQHIWYFRLIDLEKIGLAAGLVPAKSEAFISIRGRNNNALLLRRQSDK